MHLSGLLGGVFLDTVFWNTVTFFWISSHNFLGHRDSHGSFHSKT